MKILALFAILCGVLFVYGFLMADRVRITIHDIKGRPDMTVVVTVPNVTNAHTLFLFGCTAALDENAQMFCNDAWDMSSAHPIRDDQRQYPFLLRNVPRGWLMFSAAVVDAGGKTLASGETRKVR